MPIKRKHLSILVALAVTLAFLALALRHVSIARLWEVFTQARLAWVGVMICFTLTDLVIRAWRWRILLLRAADAPFSLLFRLEAIGAAVNNVLFLRAGEFARAYLAGENLDIHVLTALSSIAVERALDLAAMLTLFCWVGWTTPEFSYAGYLRLALTFLIALILGLVFLAAAGKPLEPEGAWNKKLARWPRARKFASQFALGAGALRSKRAAASAALLSLVLWNVDGLFYWAGARALHLGRVLGYRRAILVLTWSGAGASLPAAPGSFGTFEDFVKSLLMDFGVSAQKAFAFAFFNHMVSYLLVTLLGLAFLYYEEVSLGEIRHALSRRPDNAP